jgi:hypothetical protein
MQNADDWNTKWAYVNRGRWQTSIQVDGFNVKYIVGASNHGLLKDTLF